MAWIGAGWAFTIGFGSGTIRNPTSFAENVAWGAGTAVLTRPFVVNTIVRPVGGLLGRGAFAVGRDVVARPGLAAARSFAASPTASFAAAAAAGYVLGATATVSVSGVAEKKGLVREGTTESLVDFYTGGLAMADDGTPARDRSKWYETDLPILNIPGDAWYIGKYT